MQLTRTGAALRATSARWSFISQQYSASSSPRSPFALRKFPSASIPTIHGRSAFRREEDQYDPTTGGISSSIKGIVPEEGGENDENKIEKEGDNHGNKISYQIFSTRIQKIREQSRPETKAPTPPKDFYSSKLPVDQKSSSFRNSPEPEHGTSLPIGEEEPRSVNRQPLSSGTSRKVASLRVLFRGVSGGNKHGKAESQSANSQPSSSSPFRKVVPLRTFRGESSDNENDRTYTQPFYLVPVIRKKYSLVVRPEGLAQSKVIPFKRAFKPRIQKYITFGHISVPLRGRPESESRKAVAVAKAFGHSRMFSTGISVPERGAMDENAECVPPNVPLSNLSAQQGEQKLFHSDEMAEYTIDGKTYARDSYYNIPTQIIDHLGHRLYLQPNHPIYLTRSLVESAFSEAKGFNNRHHLHPVVTVADNFDRLGFPADHPGRSKTDTYYVNGSHVLRTHTSAHEPILFGELKESLVHEPHGYTLCADVYRRDSIDRSHYPVFHQMEGARCWALAGAAVTQKVIDKARQREQNIKAIEQDLRTLPLWMHRNDIAVDPSIARDAALEIQAEDPSPTFDPDTNPLQPSHEAAEVELVARHLKLSLEFLVAKVFRQAQNAGIITSAEPPRVRWVPAYFPFTSPSWELEVFWQGDWLELLGCGVSKQQLLVESGIPDSIGWAWGIGIERLAMLLYGIPDIRLFWSKDTRFLNQFATGKATKFVEFSKYPECYKDVAFWLPPSPASVKPTQGSESKSELPNEVATPSGAAAQAGGHVSSEAVEYPAFHENDLAEIVRDVAGSMAESVKLVDEFFNTKTRRKSLCYRIMYRSLDRTLTNEEVNEVHDKVRKRLTNELGVELR